MSIKNTEYRFITLDCRLYCGMKTEFFFNLNFFFIDYIHIVVVLGGELAVPFSRNPLHAGLNPL